MGHFIFRFSPKCNIIRTLPLLLPVAALREPQLALDVTLTSPDAIFVDSSPPPHYQVGSDRRAATLQEVEDFLHLKALEVDMSQDDMAGEGNHTHPATRADIASWLGSDPEALSAGDPPDFDTLAPSQKKFAIVALASPPALYYLSGRAGFGKSHLARFLVGAFRSMEQIVAITGTTVTAAGTIGGGDPSPLPTAVQGVRG